MRNKCRYKANNSKNYNMHSTTTPSVATPATQRKLKFVVSKSSRDNAESSIDFDFEVPKTIKRPISIPSNVKARSCPKKVSKKSFDKRL